MILAMKRISIQALKLRLSAAVMEAEAGNTITITRHNEPVAELGPARAQHTHRGTQFGSGHLTPALRRGTKGRYLAALLEDRGRR
jgi:antitoxin (DNA-binding transcriptional repressor) of toxin-antitoxin stability system